jgi:hypothetical protein
MKAQITKETFSSLYKAAGDFIGGIFWAVVVAGLFQLILIRVK